MKDRPTMDFYAREAEAYAGRARMAEARQLAAFLALVPTGGQILELGCGGGQDSEAMLAAGFDVTPTDGSPELARQAELRLARPVQVLLFEDIDFDARFDGVWANACLLHVPRDGLGSVISRIHRAVRTGGVLYASYKKGAVDERDQGGRYYNRPDAAWLRGVYGPDCWSTLEIEESRGGGYFNEPTDWLHVLAIKA